MKLLVLFDVTDDLRQLLLGLFALDSSALERIESKVDRVLASNERMEAMNSETQAILKRLDDATTKVAAKLQKIIDDAATAGSLSAKEINDALGPEVARLEALAADPADPVPASAPEGDGTTAPLE